MPIIKTQTNETAQGEVRRVYDKILERMPFIPKPAEVMSADPEFIPLYWDMLSYVLNRPNLSRELMAHIRLGVAMHSAYPYCVEMNSMALQQMMGMTAEQIAEFRKDPTQSQLPEKQRELVSFVVRSIREPEEITAQDTQRLRDLGWTDPDIFDATFMGAFMLTSGVLFSTFKMNED